MRRHIRTVDGTASTRIGTARSRSSWTGRTRVSSATSSADWWLPATRSTSAAGSYDLLYDSGCFHHLPPHRRISYLALLDRALKPGGHFALTCFTADEGTSTPDAELYRRSGLSGGVGYEPEDLRWIFQDLTEVELRRMTDEPPDSPAFGRSFLWTALFRKD